MRVDSRTLPWLLGAVRETVRHTATTRCGNRPTGDLTMQTTKLWTTPTATDFRFGFEITMYVAAR